MSCRRQGGGVRVANLFSCVCFGRQGGVRVANLFSCLCFRLVYPNVASFYYIRVYLLLIYKITDLIVHTLVILTLYILM